MLKWLSSLRQTITNAGEDVKKSGPSRALLVGMKIGIVPMENSMKVPQKLKVKYQDFPSWLSVKNPTSMHEDMGSIPSLAQRVKALP